MRASFARSNLRTRPKCLNNCGSNGTARLQWKTAMVQPNYSWKLDMGHGANELLGPRA